MSGKSDVLTTASLQESARRHPAPKDPLEIAGIRVEVPTDPTAVRIGEPVTIGLPFKQGVCPDSGALTVVGPAGAVPAQSRTLERWPDGSARWVLFDFRANAPAHYDVRPGVLDELPNTLRVSEYGRGVEIANGALVFRVPRRDGALLEVSDGAGRPHAVRDVVLALTRRDGVSLRPSTRLLSVESSGPVRTVLRLDATFGLDADVTLEATIRLHFVAGLPSVRFEVAVANPAAAEHSGGFWELGDRASVLIRDLSVVVSTGQIQEAVCSPEPGLPLGPVSVPFELYQDSSGGEHWNSPVHVNRDGVVPVTFRGYRASSGAVERGERATPVLWCESDRGSTGIAMRYFWQNAPKAIEVGGDRLALRLFPAQFADLHEIQGGERKTHDFYVSFAKDTVAEIPLDWVRQPALAAAAPEWYCAAGAASYLTPVAADPHHEYVALVESIIEGPHSFERGRERIDEYGWRNFGDIYADHEAVLHTGDELFVSHYNNQYDAIAGFAYQFFRSGDARWWTAMQELAHHVRDIDIYHADGDKAAYSHGLFWHTCHYVDAGRSSHRCYPRAKGVDGGGPANEHAYSTGLMLHYYLTGDVASREAAIELAEWILRLDDGGRTPFRWLSRADTGLASKTTTPEYHGPGRGAGNAIVVLLNGFRLTGRRAFIEKADALIRRCVNPQDDIEQRELRDPEHRWSYSVFLQALGRYLDEKIVRGELDDRYAYARESLLHYARWMADHEYLYLEKPELLEYPTETWAAQEFRKSDVFNFAAKHASGEERVRFLERGAFFFREATRSLGEHATRFTARPRVLLLSNGLMQAAFDGHGDQFVAPVPRHGGSVPAPASFVPQKSIVKRRIKQLALTAAAAFAAGAAWLLVAVL